jgi:hypothetical protein
MMNHDIPKEFLVDDIGVHNGQMDESTARLIKGNTYRDLSTIWVTPTRGNIKARVVSAFVALMRPMNQPFIGPIFVEEDEVGVAYQKAFDMILGNAELSKWKFILTCEDDNLPPSDGLLKLYTSIDEGYDCVAGLYWTKGEGGQPMIYGNPAVMPRNFVPQVPQVDALQHCNGLGQGFNLWRIESLKTKLKDMPKPWFKTVQEKGQQFTQDLWFYNEAAKYGFKVACDTRVKVGHLDTVTGIVW